MFKITKKIEKKFAKNPLYSKDGQGMSANVIVKFFLPCTAATWLITEAELQDNGDYLLYGYIYVQEWEWGYIHLSELKKLTVKYWTVEIDKYLGDKATVGECVKELGYV